MAKDLTFGTPTQIDPTVFASANFRQNCPDGIEDPIDRDEKWILKEDDGGAKLFLQKLNADNTWAAETTIYDGPLWGRGVSRIAADGAGNLMVGSVVNPGGIKYVRTWFIPRTGGATLEEDHVTEPNSFPVNFQLKILNSHQILMVYNVRQAPALGSYDLRYKIWESNTTTWGPEVDLGHPVDDLGGTVLFGMAEGSADVSPVDGMIHIVAVGDIGTSPYGHIYFKKVDPSDGSGTWSLIRENPTFTADRVPVIWASNISADKSYISVWKLNGGTLASSVDLLIGSPAQWDSYQVSAATDKSAQAPHCIIDQDDSVYFCWSEYDDAEGTMALWARGSDPNGVMNDTVKVGESLWKTTNSWDFPQTQDPEYPHFVRQPRFKPLIDLCVVWGDTYPAPNNNQNNPSTWITCAPIGNGNGNGNGNGGDRIVLHNEVYVNDKPSGNPWLKWKGV
jgi:hypothetical protein